MTVASGEGPHSAAAAAPHLPALVTGGLVVTGMHCQSCVALIEESLGQEPGVVSVSVDLDSARATVAFDSLVTGLDKLCAVVAGLGYGASPSVPPHHDPAP